MAHRVRDYFFILPADEYRLLKECLPRHSIGYDALDLAISSPDEKRAFTCSENELQDVSNPSNTSFHSVRPWHLDPATMAGEI